MTTTSRTNTNERRRASLGLPSRLILAPTPHQRRDDIDRRVAAQPGRGAAATARYYVTRQARLGRMTLPSGYGRTVTITGS